MWGAFQGRGGLGAALLGWLLLLLGGAVTTFIPSQLYAAEEPEGLIHQGVILRQQGQDSRAHGYFKRAYDISHTPRSAAQLGLCEHAIESWTDAEIHLAEALSTSDPWILQNKSTLQGSLQTVRRHLGRIDVSGAPPRTTVHVANRPPAMLPPDGVIWVDPGDVHLRFDAAGYEPLTWTGSVAAGGISAVQTAFMAASRSPAELAARIPSAVATQSRQEDVGVNRSRTPRLVGLGVGAVGLVLGVAGGVVYMKGATKLDAIKNDAAAGRFYDMENGNWQTWEHTGVGLVIGGAAALTTGAIIFLVNRSGSRADTAGSRIAVAPGIVSGVPVALIQGNFE